MVKILLVLTTIEAESAINQFISFGNSNQGFLSAIFSACSLLVSVVAIVLTFYNSVLPYKKRLECTGCLYEKDGKIIGTVDIVNCGNRAIMIKEINIFRNQSRLHVGCRMKSHIFRLMPGVMKTAHIRIYDEEELIKENIMDVNPFIYIEIVDTENKHYRFKNHFAVG